MADDPEQAAPFWSVMIPTYNPPAFFEQTLRGVLDQDQGPGQMQIAVVDDASTGVDPEPIVRRIAGERIEIYRQPRNVGLAENWNACIRHARGRWIHLMHQDDTALPGYYATIRAAVENRPEVGLAFTRCANVDENGNWIYVSRMERPEAGIIPDWLEKLAINNRIQCPAVSVRAEAYATAGRFRKDLVYAVDWEMWARIASRYAVWFDPKIAMTYRVHSQSETARLQEIAATAGDERRAIALIGRLLPGSKRGRLMRGALLKLANKELDQADVQIDANATKAAIKSLAEAVKSGWRSPSALARAAGVMGRILLRG